MTAPDLPALIKRLADAGVEFVVVGGVAAGIHGSTHVTFDLDVVYRRTPENLERIAAALEPIRPYPRGSGGPPVLAGRRRSRAVLTSRCGPLSAISTCSARLLALGSYEQLLSDAETITLEGRVFRCVSLRRLIALNRAAGRPRDLNALAELEALLEERDSRS